MALAADLNTAEAAIAPPAPRTLDLTSGAIGLDALAVPGAISQSARVSYTDAQTNLLRTSVRLDTTFMRAQGDDTWRAGDFLSAPGIQGVAPVRLGGLQWQGRAGALGPRSPGGLATLAPGAVAYSVGTGYLRRDYGSASNSYDGRAAALASVRAGVTDWLTLEGHGEGVARLAAGGVGVTARLGDFGVLRESAALGGEGSRWGQAWELSRDGVLVRASHVESSDGYRTLATMQGGALPVRRRAEFSLAGALLGGDLTLGYARCEASVPDGAAPPPSSVGTMAYARKLPRRWTVTTSTSRDFAQSVLAGGVAVSHPFL